MKLLRRKVLIRKSDFDQTLRHQALKCGYTSATWHQCSMEALAKEVSWLVLSGVQFTDGIFVSNQEMKLSPAPKFWLLEQNEQSVRFYIQYMKQKNNMYNPSYYKWAWKYENDCIYIQPRRNVNWQPLGVAVLERLY